ncbi:MAG: FAD-dependent oxidoreductase, partial [Chlamydiia bacterium]|nr:FAD-dependent oxidoreductase [Chlamydiia bacterium]
IAIQVGATLLHMNHGGSGLLLGGVPGVKKGSVVVIGGGSAGTEAARLAFGFGAEVTIFDKKLERLRELDLIFHGGVTTLYSTPISLRKALTHADLVVGAVLVPGKRAPRIITREMIASMPKGSVFVDVAIDQGGCSDTSRPTSHTHPTYVEEGVIHYCVTNMPGACSRTATRALTNATMSYALLLANKGYRQALLGHKSLREGLNTYLGKVTHEGVAHDLDYPFTPFHTL